jgi:hypothetical protein
MVFSGGPSGICGSLEWLEGFGPKDPGFLQNLLFFWRFLWIFGVFGVFGNRGPYCKFSEYSGTAAQITTTSGGSA